jgi:hypothetical protein
MGDDGHLAVNCPNKKDKSSKEGKDKEDDGKTTVFFKKKKTLVTNLKDLNKFGYLKRINLLLYVSCKAKGRHWTLDNGCTQHMAGDYNMLNSLNSNASEDYDNITLANNGKR